MTKKQSKIVPRQRGKAEGVNGVEGCREMPGAAGLERVLEEKSGGAGTRPCACDAGAASRNWRVRGPVCFVAQDTRLVQQCNPGRHPAKRQATRATTLGLACAGLFGDASPGAARARVMRPLG